MLLPIVGGSQCSAGIPRLMTRITMIDIPADLAGRSLKGHARIRSGPDSASVPSMRLRLETPSVGETEPDRTGDAGDSHRRIGRVDGRGGREDLPARDRRLGDQP